MNPPLLLMCTPHEPPPPADARPPTRPPAHPARSIWGVGLSVEQARTIPQADWPGTNLLGKALTVVRDELRAAQAQAQQGAAGAGQPGAASCGQARASPPKVVEAGRRCC